MKTSAVLASMLFGSLAVAAPFDKRALVYKTEVVTETVVVYTTVFDDEVVPQATTTPAGYFYEQPKSPSSAAAKPTPSPAAPPAPEQPKSSSVYVAPPQAPAPTPSPAPVVESPKPVVESPKPVVESPKPVEQPQASPSPVYQAPAAPAASSPAPAAPVTPSKPSTGSGQYAGDITIYEPNGNTGACGTNLGNEEMVVALSIEAFGASTYDRMTGAATNKWCGQQINVYYQGRTVSAKIMDMCPGCKGDDIDLSPAAWRQLTGSDEKTRYKATWSTA